MCILFKFSKVCILSQPIISLHLHIINVIDSIYTFDWTVL